MSFLFAGDGDWFFWMFVKMVVKASVTPAIQEAMEEDRRLELAKVVM